VSGSIFLQIRIKDSVESKTLTLCGDQSEGTEGSMRPWERRETGEQDLFRSRLDQPPW
jgi:hypothetical protein